MIQSIVSSFQLRVAHGPVLFQVKKPIETVGFWVWLQLFKTILYLRPRWISLLSSCVLGSLLEYEGTYI